MGDVQRTEVAGDIMPGPRVIQIFIIGGGAVDLQNLRAQVAHVDATGNRIRAVYRILVHDVGIA